MFTNWSMNLYQNQKNLTAKEKAKQAAKANAIAKQLEIQIP